MSISDFILFAFVLRIVCGQQFKRRLLFHIDISVIPVKKFPMFQIGKAKSNNDVDIIFQFSNTLNSVTQFNYKFIKEPVNKKTKTVSGLDVNNPINCVFSINNESHHDKFVISMFRAPCLLPDVVDKIKLNVVKVITNQYQEFWYVIGIKKGSELPAAMVYKKIKANENEYYKVRCLVSGFVPFDLLRAFNYKINNKNHLHGLLIAAPTPTVNTNTVNVIKGESNSTA
ncbi:ORF8 [Choristoneura fumiferana granulovirus]|uniref:ORF8 n=1 Tax=Choristoneura fumiferana granulovirus TaxID=56947 RepID=Q8JL59_GVCF|nr:ORF8 [Choristoneura fumiferana granulovirus]